MIERDSLSSNNSFANENINVEEQQQVQIVGNQQEIRNASLQQQAPRLADSFEEIPAQSEVLNCADRIKYTQSHGRSESFKNLQEEIEKNYDLLGDLSREDFQIDEISYANFMELYQAVSAYLTSHATTTDSKSVTTYQSALGIRKAMDKKAFGKLENVNLSEIGKAVYTERERKYAKEHVERFLKYYIKYCARVDADLLASDEEKLERKWDALKSCERNIEVYLTDKKFRATQRHSKLNAADAFLEQEYLSLKTQMLFRNKLRGNKDDRNIKNDEGLTKKQLAAISRIDTWVIRNFRNGGYMSVMGQGSDRTDIIGRLLSMDKRKRLYIYYLIEKKERLKPSADSIVDCQISYEPDLGKFKDRMIANKLMFYKRFSGGYVYWNKLTEAMGMADQLQPMFDHTSLLYHEKDEKNDELDNLINPHDEVEELRGILKLSLEAIEISKEIADESELLRDNKKAKKINPKRQKQKELEEKLKQITKEINKRLQNAKATKSSVKNDVKTITNRAVGDASKGVAAVKQFFDDKQNQSWSHVKAETMVKISKVFDPVLNGAKAFSSLAGAVFALISLKDDASKMTWIDITSTGTNFLSNSVKTVKSATSAVQTAGTTNAATKVLASNTVGYVAAGLETGVAVMNTASYVKSGKSRVKASKLAKKMLNDSNEKTDKEMYTEGMLKLNRKLGHKQKTSALGSVGTATLTTTSTVLLATSVITCGISAIAGLVTLGVATALSVSDAFDAKKMKNVLFDTFYKIDEVFKSEKEKWERAHGKKLSDKQQDNLREIIRSRIAAKEGFYSPRHAAKAVAGKFADHLIEGANKNDNDSKMYISFIKGLGLPFNPQKSVPKASDIAKKLCG